jgi:nucleotide-binding universal stress UspA family protein
MAEAVELCGKEGVVPGKVIREGHPVEEILKGAEELKADLIVMGSHGRSAMGAAFLGSVAIGVLHSDSGFPVLIVRR